MTNEIIISKTAVAKGFGSDRFKSVTNLTKEEKLAIKEGKIVLVDGCPEFGGTAFRQVAEKRGKFYHRMPSPEVIAKIAK